MNKLLTLLLAFTMTPLFAGVSGSMALTSDYFFRGASQTMGSSALQGGVDYNNGGFYAGVWGSTVDFGTDTELEYDFYTGYTVALDELAIDVGVIQYNYDGSMDSVEEYFIVMNYAWMSFGFAFDQDNSNSDYTEIEVNLPFITFADVSFRHGEFGDDTNYQQITISKSLNSNFSLGFELVSEESEELELDERMAFYLSYTF